MDRSLVTFRGRKGSFNLRRAGAPAAVATVLIRFEVPRGECNLELGSCLELQNKGTAYAGHALSGHVWTRPFFRLLWLEDCSLHILLSTYEFLCDVVFSLFEKVFPSAHSPCSPKSQSRPFSVTISS